MTAAELLDACTELADARLGVLAACCPHCQGYLEVQPLAGRVVIGYLAGNGNPRFDAALSLPCADLLVTRTADGGMTLAAPGRSWEFRE
jgi:hypothetical protein